MHWTESLKKALNYDPRTAAAVDNGNFHATVAFFFTDVFLQVRRGHKSLAR